MDPSAHFCYVQVINNWLNGNRNFFTGRALYTSLGTDKALKDLLAKGNTPFAMDAMVKALQGYQPPPPASEPPPDKVTGEMPNGNDAVLNALQQEWKKPYAEMNHMKALLHKWGNDNTPEAIKERERLAFAILEKEQVCISIWAKRDYYQQHGQLPATKAKEQVIPAEPLELGKFIESCKRRIRRNRLSMQLHPDQPQYAEKYLHFKQLYKQATGTEYTEK